MCVELHRPTGGPTDASQDFQKRHSSASRLTQLLPTFSGYLKMWNLSPRTITGISSLTRRLLCAPSYTLHNDGLVSIRSHI